MTNQENALPGRREPVDKECRFYVSALDSVRLRIIEEGMQRDVAYYKLAGMVLAMWVAAGCPDNIATAPGKATAEPVEADQQ